MVELVDTPDSKSGASKMACGFESHLRYKSKWRIGVSVARQIFILERGVRLPYPLLWICYLVKLVDTIGRLESDSK